jgi:hypothetical protein
VAGCSDTDGTVARLSVLPATPERLAALTALGPSGAASDLLVDSAPSGLNGTALQGYLDRAPFRRSPENATLPTEAFDQPVYYDGQVYNLTTTTVADRLYVDYELHVLYEGVEDPGRSVRYEDLRGLDRRALADAFPIPESTLERLREAGATPGFPGGDVGGYYAYENRVRYNRSARNSSRLVAPRADTITYNGTRFSFVVGRDGEERVPINRYAVAERRSVADYARSLERRYRFDLPNLSQAEQDVFEAAIGTTYSVTGDGDSAEALHDRLAEGEQLPVRRVRVQPLLTPPGNLEHWLVRYDGADWVVAWHGQGDRYGGLG